MLITSNTGKDHSTTGLWTQAAIDSENYRLVSLHIGSFDQQICWVAGIQDEFSRYEETFHPMGGRRGELFTPPKSLNKNQINRISGPIHERISMPIVSPESSELQKELDAFCPLSDAQVAFYQEKGYIKLKNILSPALLEHFRCAIHDRVADLSRDAVALDQRDTYGKAFLQIMNLWTESPRVKQFVFGKRLASIAAQLIGATGVRIYHDQALYKEAGGGITPWHADQYYWPVDSEKTITAWIPLQLTPPEMGPLIFSERSHRFQIGRDLEISDESEITLKQALETFPVESGSYDLGDVSFHSGWTFHRAWANTTDKPREVMTMIYMDEHIRVAPPKNKNHVADMKRWMPGLQPGDPLNSPLNPVIYSTEPSPLSTPAVA